MIIFDVNVLVAAFRSDHPHHDRVRAWLKDALGSSTTVGVPDLVWVGFIRVCTNPRIFPVSSSIEETLAFVRAFTAQPGYVHIGGLRDDIEPLLATVASASASANLTTDAYIAAIAVSLAANVATLDRDFRRFDRLNIVEPPALPHDIHADACEHAPNEP